MNPLRGGVSGLKSRFIIETEDTINTLNERRQRVEAELVTIDADIAEARTTLQFLKKGVLVEPVAQEQPKKQRKPVVPLDDVKAAVEMQEDRRFTSLDISEVTGQSQAAAHASLKRLLNEGLIYIVEESRVRPHQGRTYTVYRAYEEDPHGESD